jgi:hypothetical protein
MVWLYYFIKIAGIYTQTQVVCESTRALLHQPCVKNARRWAASTALFALLSCKIPVHLFAKPPAEVHNARQCSGIVCAFRLVELQNTCASIRQTTYRGA